jgi:RNA polymerase primary sigma factor
LGQRGEEPSIGAFGRYRRDVAHLAPLRAREEFPVARRLEELELACWVEILSYPPIVECVLAWCATALGSVPAELDAVHRAASLRRARRSSAHRDRLRKLAERAAERIRQQDRDRDVMRFVLGEIEKLASEVPGRSIATRLGIAPHAKPFHSYLGRVRAAYARAQAAKSAFVTANLRLVMVLARRFDFGGMPLSDIVQEGNLGLIKAVDRFDYRRGYRFSTYASWWIRHAIQRALADKSRAIRLPVHLLDASTRIAKAERALTSKLGRVPTCDELQQATEIPAQKIERTGLAARAVVSLDKTVDGEEDGRKLLEIIGDPNAENRTHVDSLVDRAMASELRAEVDRLTPVEAEIVRLRFGLDTDEAMTLKQIGDRHGLSRERIRQIQETALEKLRKALRRRDLL